MQISVVLPAKNEAEGLRKTLLALRALLPDAELIVTNVAAGARHDGSDVRRGIRPTGNKLRMVKASLSDTDQSTGTGGRVRASTLRQASPTRRRIG